MDSDRLEELTKLTSHENILISNTWSYIYCGVVIHGMELNNYCVVVVQYPIIPLRNVIVEVIILNLLNASERSF